MGWPFELSFLVFSPGGLTALLFALLLTWWCRRSASGGTYFAIGTLAWPKSSASPPRNAASGQLTDNRLRRPLRSGAYATSSACARHGLQLAVSLAVCCARGSAQATGEMVGEDEQAAQASGVPQLAAQAGRPGAEQLCFFAAPIMAPSPYRISYYPELPFTSSWTFDAVLPPGSMLRASAHCGDRARRGALYPRPRRVGRQPGPGPPDHAPGRTSPSQWCG